jgi:hypothetical protein
MHVNICLCDDKPSIFICKHHEQYKIHDPGIRGIASGPGRFISAKRNWARNEKHWLSKPLRRYVCGGKNKDANAPAGHQTAASDTKTVNLLTDGTQCYLLPKSR